MQDNLEQESLLDVHNNSIDILDTEYAGIITAIPKAANFLINHISLYRQTNRPTLKDILLYRIGAYMQIFSVEDKDIKDIIVEQHNWRLSSEQRQQVIQFLAEQLGIIL